MKDTFANVLRSLRRDYFNSWNGEGKAYKGITGMVVGGGGTVVLAVALPVAAGISLLAGAMVATATLAGLSTLGVAMQTLGMRRHENGHLHDGSESLTFTLNQQKNTRLIGPGRDVCLLINTQRLVEDFTKNSRRDATLPQSVAEKLAPYLKDAEEAASRVQAFNTAAQPVAHIEFVRRVFDANGNETLASVAKVTPANAPQPNPAPPPAAKAKDDIILPKSPQVNKRRAA